MAVTQATELADFSSGIGTAGAILEVDNTNNRIGIGTTNPQALLQVGQIIKMDGATGIITATSFSGTASLASNLTGTPDITVNNLTGVAATFTGVLTYEDVTNIDSIGIITARSDISIADKIIHTGDTNTAIRFPSADTFSVETAGVERLRVDSTGDVGLVGIATATGLVVVAGSGVYAGHTGVITATAFVGDGSNLTGVISGVELLQGGSSVGTGVTSINFSGATVSAPDSVGLSTITVTSVPTTITVADESSDTTCFPLFVTAATGDLGPKSGTNLTFNSSSGALTATSFVGAVTGNATGLSGTPNISCGTGAFSGNVTLQANLDLQDNDKILVGTGDDLEIFHDGSDTYISDVGVGNLYITSTDGTINLQTNASENAVKCFENGAVNLYYDGNAKLATKSDGIDVTGEVQCDSLDVDGTTNFDDDVAFTGASYNASWDKSANSLKFADNAKIQLGSGEDLQIYHDGSNSIINDSGTGNLRLQAAGTTRVEVTTNGITVTGRVECDEVRAGDDDKIQLGDAQDFRIYHDGSTNIIDGHYHPIELRHQSEVHIKCVDDGAVELYHNGTKNFETNSAGVKVSAGNLYLDRDDAKVVLGAGDDLEIYHDGSASYIHDNGTGDLNVCMESGSKFVIQSGTSGSHLAEFNHNGAAELFHNGTQKLETTSTGITVSGIIVDRHGGDIRRAIQTTKTSAHTLVETDTGKHVYISTGGVTVPNGVFTAGAMVTIVNNSGSNQTITQGSSMTMYNTADATTGNRTLAGRGVCTILFTSGSESYISGAGLS